VGEALGHQIFYLTLRLTGQRGAYLLLLPVVATYVLFSRRIHRLLAPYVRHRFPGHGPLRRWVDGFRIVHSFGKVLVDRAWLGVSPSARLRGTLEGQEVLEEIIGRGKGLVLLLAHVGNWQTALSHLSNLPVSVHALMRIQDEEVTKHFFELRDEPSPFGVIRADGFLGGALEANAALQRGEVVTVMGDRLIKGHAVTVDFFGSPVRMPIAAFMLALASGAPVAVLLTAKTSRRDYILRVWDVFDLETCDRGERDAVLTTCARKFVRSLESYLQQYPYQWYNFFDLWNQ